MCLLAWYCKEVLSAKRGGVSTKRGGVSKLVWRCVYYGHVSLLEGLNSGSLVPDRLDALSGTMGTI